MDYVLRITTPYACGGVILNGIVVVKCAPIFKYMHGWTKDKVEGYCAAKGWACDPLSGVSTSLKRRASSG